jgi:two-component system sensor histidine kinase BaeS
MHSSIREIRARLLLLLSRAFVLVMSLSLTFFLASTIYFLIAPSSNLPLPFSGILQGYYIGHGSWAGVETVFEENDDLKHSDSILLDKDQYIILDHRTKPLPEAESKYKIQPGDFVFSLTANGEEVGSLVFISFSVQRRFNFVRGAIFPVALISCVLAIFLVVVAVLLVRRFVNPLADVIYAARSVADGKLDTRIPTHGPQDLRSLSESFNEMASALERNDRHELRTPLSVIRGRLEGIVDGIYAADSGQVSLALEQTYLLERLGDDLRLLTLAETRQLHFEKNPVDLAKLAQHTVDMFSAEAHEKNISLYLENRNGDFIVELDPQRTEQVIGNLIGNSLRYIPDGSKIWLTIEETQGSVRLSVNDNGPGVAEDELPFLFDRFWRKDKSRARNTGGTGLGLAIAKQLIEAQGGTIEVRNLSEGGLQIQISLKLKPPRML